MNSLQVTIFSSFAFALLSGTSVLAQAVDTVYTNGQIYTVNDKRPWAEAFAVKDGRFVAIGSNGEILELRSDSTKVVDLDGQFVMPGLIDSHTHPVRVVMLEDVFYRNDQFEPKTPDEFGRSIKEYAENNPDKQWIYGTAFSWTYFDGTGIEMNRYFLDKYVSDRPVVVEDDGGHVVVVNSKALEIAGITEDTKDPEGGTITRDENGVATGKMVASPAIKMVLKHHPRHDPEDVYRAALKSTKIQNSFGITGAKIVEGDREQMEAFKRLDEEGKLTLDVRMHPYLEEFYFGYSNEDVLKDRDAYATEHFKVTGAKMFIDSSFFGRAAAIKNTYVDSDDRGKLFTTYEKYRDNVVRLNGMGLSVTTHTVGDRALELNITAMEESAKINGLEKVRALRNQVAHAFMIDPPELPRLRHVDAVLEFSPAYWVPAPLWNTLEKDLPMAVIENFFPIRHAINAGVLYTAASDWNQSPIDPFLHIETLTTRRMPGADPSAKSLNPNATISLPDAVKAYTINAAKAMLMEDKIGSIESGKSANFIILNDHLFDVPGSQIHTLYPTKVFFEGKLIHENNAKVDRS